MTSALAWQEQGANVHTTNDATASPSSLVELATTDHTIRFETWVGYNSTWKHFKVRALTTSCVPCSSAHTCSHPGARRFSPQMWADEVRPGRRISYLNLREDLARSEIAHMAG